jgi:hypothetical protein
MKKLILLFALAFVMCGCNTHHTNSYKIGNHIFYEIIIDSCEYIHCGNAFSHKGNCKFCAERRKKEQEELIRKIKEQ